MNSRIRIIPLTIAAASLFLAIKVIDLVRGSEQLSQAMLVGRVEAETPPPAAPKAEAKPAEAAKPEVKAEGGHGEGEKKDKNANPNISSDLGDITERRFTSVELELLQKLSKRREELDSWQGNLQIKEAALDATEKRIDEKIASIEAMKKEVTALLAEYNKIEDAKIGSLVKIYENMKPVDAARIFDEIEMPILLLVIDRMSEKKAAPIFAAMDSRKAKQLTVELAERRRLESNRIKQAGAASGVPTDAAAPKPAAGK